MNWFPWRALLSRFARRQGFMDPVGFLAKFQQFAQPAEVAAPMELLRAGVVFHARGLINTRAIQHNMDWVWPYWVQRQFDPSDISFIPRAFTITHVNLTHRNWTAVGLPNGNVLPIVDPRGLLTPFFDGWSLDVWIVGDDGRALYPSRLADDAVRQRLDLDAKSLAVCTDSQNDGRALNVRSSVVLRDASPHCVLSARGRADDGGWLVAAVRPYNPEGVAFVPEIRLRGERNIWEIDGQPCVHFGDQVERHAVSAYGHGDVAQNLLERPARTQVTCDVGMATAAAMFRLQPGKEQEIAVAIDLSQDRRSKPIIYGKPQTWHEASQEACSLELPAGEDQPTADGRLRFLYDAARSTLILHSPAEVYPGPYTYKRFWYRDAALMINAMLCAGFTERAERALDRFDRRQNRHGFFHSQEGEWDANGMALWVLHRFGQLTGKPVKKSWRKMIERGGWWIIRKRLPRDSDARHAGLLPAGFSAEHLGNNDYYYWDDYWAVAGLRAAATMCRQWSAKLADRFSYEADDFMEAIEESLRRAGVGAEDPLPASPNRRVDTGAVGSLCAGFPLQLYGPQEPRVLASARWLVDQWSVHGAYFHGTVHSGINAYLTLHLAQVLMRAGDDRFLPLVRAVAELATPTGQWPEAIHPLTLGGCMGDGQHAWAAAEWTLMLRNMFVREEGEDLVLGSGLVPDWRREGRALEFGPAPTPYGPVTVRASGADPVQVQWEAQWRQAPPRLVIALPGMPPQSVSAPEDRGEVTVGAANTPQESAK